MKLATNHHPTRAFVYRCTCLLWAAWRPGTDLAREFLAWDDALDYALGG